MMLAADPASAQSVLRIGLNDDPDALDPTISRAYTGRLVFAALCDKLFDVTPDLKIVPQLATGYDWAFVNPLRKIFYNLALTSLSIAVALVVGTIEYCFRCSSPCSTCTWRRRLNATSSNSCWRRLAPRSRRKPRPRGWSCRGSARSTIYTLTNRRIVMRIGMALSAPAFAQDKDWKVEGSATLDISHVQMTKYLEIARRAGCRPSGR